MRIRKLKIYQKIFELLIKYIDLLANRFNLRVLTILKEILQSFKAELIFFVGSREWAVYWIYKNISDNLNKLGLINSELSNKYYAKNKIIHYCNQSKIFNGKEFVNLKKSNKFVITWFHIIPNDKLIKYIPILNRKIDCLVTPSPITRNKLIELGFNENKIVVIPFGVDLSHFKRYNEFKKKKLREKFNLPNNKLIIGCFQKDGVGWGDGTEPKLIKGPDIFCEVVRKLNEKYIIHIFLTGPARGYVKKKLDEYKIPYTHLYLDYYPDIVECYNVLDLYLITSRVEGGPMALLECMATGIPLITTNVGMASYVIKNGVNGFITDVENLDQIYIHAKNLLTNNELRAQFIKNGLNIVQDYSWEKIINKYYLKIYQNLLNNKNK